MVEEAAGGRKGGDGGREALGIEGIRRVLASAGAVEKGRHAR